MESHILNSYHQARYRSIGHKIMRAKSDSLSSEGSNQNSPEYAQIALQRVPSTAQSEDSIGEDWCQNQTINTTQSSQDTSSDDESSDGQDDAEENLVVKEDRSDDDDIDDNLMVQEINVDSDENIDVDDCIIPVRQNGLHNEDTLVEGHDYDVITVYEVNPDLDLIEASSDDDSQEDFSIPDKDDEGEYRNPDEIKYNYRPQSTSDNNIDLLDSQVVSNVDEYFIKEKDILADDGPVVKDVDEYFIKDKGKIYKKQVTVPNVDDFFIKNKLPEEESTKFHIIPESLPNVDEFLVVENNYKKASKAQKVITAVVPQEMKHEVKRQDIGIKDDNLVETLPEGKPEEKVGVSINESDLEILPSIEDLKRYLLEEMSYNKFKSIQKSCSLPHSPLHGASVCMDVDDAKTCLSFEDLNLDLSDLAFDNDKDKTDASKSDDIPRTLTDEDINSFLITNKPETKKETVDDLDPQEMEIEDSLESTIVAPVEPFRELTSTPVPSVIPSTKVLEFCVEKTPPSKDLQKDKVVVLDSQATPMKVVIDPPRQAKVVPLNTKFNSAKVISMKPVSKHIPVAPMVRNPVATRPVALAPKTVVAKQFVVESNVVPADLDDFVDVESCNDAVIPVLEANNLNSLLEQFEATEKLNKSKKPMRVVPSEEQKKVKSLTNGMRLQDAGVQLKNNKMRQILMPTTINAAVRRSPSPVHSDHDYCSSKKRHSLPNIKGGQSLLKPEVLSSNSRILNSRHRSCKNKKVVYNLSSDDEEKVTKNKKVISDSELKKKTIAKPSVKPPAQSNCRKKLSPIHSDDVVLKSNNSVIYKCASKASDTPCSQNSNGSIKLTIKNKSEVILNCDLKDSQIKHNDIVEKCKVSSSASNIPSVSEIKQEKQIKIVEKYIKQEEKHVNGDEKYVKQAEKHYTDEKHMKNMEKYANVEGKHTKHVEKHIKHEEKYIKDIEKHTKGVEKNIKEVVRIKNKNAISLETELLSVKEEPRPKEEKKDDNFYTALFSNKQDVKILQVVPIKKEINAFEEELNKANEIKKEEPHKRKKLNLQEYKLRKGAGSNNSSTAVSPESIFPDMPLPTSEKTVKPLILTLPSDDKTDNEAPKQFYDPIREASRKIVANAKKQKAEALRKRDEDIVMSKIPKVDNLQLQPLISDAEMLKIVGMAQPESTPEPIFEKPQLPADYDEIIMVSVGTSTDEDIFKKLKQAEIKMIDKFKKKNEKSVSPPNDTKSRINFKINKSENVLKQNVFDLKKDKRHEDNKQTVKIDKARYKDITATLKSVGKQVDTKISSNSLFASIQDVVMKKAPEDNEKARAQKPKSPVEKGEVYKFGRPTIVREYDANADHGEDKVILHLDKQRNKPISANITIQTDPILKNIEDKAKTIAKEKSSVNRRRTESDMSMSSDASPASPARVKETKTNTVVKKDKPEKRSLSKDKRSKSKDRYTTATIKYRRRSRSLSRSRRRRSPTRSRSRSRGRFRRYRRSERSDSPYKRKRRSRSRSYHKRRSASRPSRRSLSRPSPRRSQSRRRRSPSLRKTYRSKSRSIPRSKSPVAKKPRQSPQIVDEVKSMTPPLRKPTVSESSDSSTSSSSSSSSDSSSSSNSSASSGKSRRSATPYKEPFIQKFRSFSSEDRENNTPVEERRIVFVGKLAKDITKSTLRSQFSKFGHVIEVRLHSKEDGSRYGFVTYQRPRDAWSAVEAAASFPQYDVGFGGRRAFCRQSYADLDGIEAKYTESAFHGAAVPATRRNEDNMSFEQMLLDMKKKLSQRKTETKHDDP